MTGRRLTVRAMVALIGLCAVLLTPGRAMAAAKAAALPPLAVPVANATLLTLDGQPVVLSKNAAWVLRRGGGRWWPLRHRLMLPARIAAVSAGARAALIDRSAPAVGRVEIVGLAGDTLAGRSPPPLPLPLGSAQAAWEGESLLVGGVAPDGSSRLFRLEGTGRWAAQHAWPGGAPTALAAQNRGRFVILAGGRQWRWQAATGWRPGAAAPGAIVGGTGGAIGQAHLLFAVARQGQMALYSYSTITDAWADLGRLPAGPPAAIAAAGDGLVVATRDGGVLRSRRVSPGFHRQGLAAIDVAIVAVYMLSMLGMGLYFYRRANADSASEFFLAGRRVPFWAAGLSMFAGTIGSVNYLAYPAKSFETDWQYMMSKVTYVGALLVVALWLAPFLRRLNLVSVYGYLEARFHLAIRLLASGLWVLLQLGARLGIILYLPALAISAMTGWNVVACIVAIGGFTIVYTALGGMRAVIWTDVVQVFVLMGGALFAILFILHDIGLTQFLDTTATFGKAHAINLAFDVKQPTIWTFLALAVLEGILCFPRDQIVMQRVLATASPREASWSILTFAAVLLPSAVLFYGIGTALFAFYRAHPAALDPLLPIDAVFPTFIGTQLPVGVVGLLVAGILAAAMGVLSGIINSVATLVSVDFYERFRPAATQRRIVRFSEIVSALVGLIGIVIAIILSRLNVHSLLDLTIELGGVFGGSFAGAYPLGMFSRRANWQGAAIGIVVSAALTLTVWGLQLFHPYLYLAFAIAVSLGVGWLASLFFSPPSRPLDGLTLFTRRRA